MGSEARTKGKQRGLHRVVPLIAPALVASALVLASFAPPTAASPTGSGDGSPAPLAPPETQNVPIQAGQQAPPQDTPYRACLAKAQDPTVCGGVPDVFPSFPPYGYCSPGGSQEETQYSEQLCESNKAAEAAVSAAREAVAVSKERGGAVDGSAAYLTALGAARRAGADEGTASIAAGQAVAELSYRAPANEAEDSGDEPSAGAAAADSEAATKASATEGGTTAEGAATPAPAATTRGGATAPAGGDKGRPPEAAASPLLGASSDASPFVLGVAVLLITAGVLGLLVVRKRRNTL